MLLDLFYYENAELESVRKAIETKRSYEYKKMEKREEILNLRKQASETLNKMEKAATIIKTV
jgi:hypothetical protein